MSRCRWCGRFIAADTQPMWGLDYWGVPIGQRLCPPHQNDWRYLAAYNTIRYHGMRR